MQVIATAGHVNHGKSTLVRALTGMEPDRWAEERRRGLTIDLGFAWMTLPSGQQVAFVDVPGTSGSCPTCSPAWAPSAVLFVVAADEGWMPQSEEHLAAVDALGIPTGCSRSPAATWSTRRGAAPGAGQARRDLARRGGGGGGQRPHRPGWPRSGGRWPGWPRSLPAAGPRRPGPAVGGPGIRIKGSGTVVTGILPFLTSHASSGNCCSPVRR